MPPRLRRRSLALAAASIVAGLTSACTDDQGSTEAFCAEVREVPALEAVLARFTETEPDALDDRIAKARAAYHDLADAAPDEIRSQTEDLVDVVDEILDAVADHPTDQAAAADQLRKAMDDHPNAEAARAKVASFAEEECDVRLDPTLSPSATTTVAPSTTSEATTTTGG